MYDGLGSTRQLLDDDQTVTDTYSYEAFGNLMGSTGSTPNPYKYVGSLGYYQTGSSLMHLGARYYMPEMGRFVQPDPVARDAERMRLAVGAWAESPYSYCRQNPAAYRDPAGLLSVCEKCKNQLDACMAKADKWHTTCLAIVGIWSGGGAISCSAICGTVSAPTFEIGYLPCMAICGAIVAAGGIGGALYCNWSYGRRVDKCYADYENCLHGSGAD